MGVISLVIAVLTAGYILGVWTGGVVFRQRQSAYEDAVAGELARAGIDPLIADRPETPVIVLGETPSPSERRW